MTAMVCFELMLEAVEAANDVMESGVLLVIAAVALGVGVVYGLNLIIDKRTSHEVAHTADESHPKAHDNIDKLVHSDHYAEHKPDRSGSA